MTTPRVAVIVACPESGPTVDASVATFLREVEGRGEVVAVGPSASRLAGQFPGLRAVDRPSGWLVPELWRDGLRESDAELVAFSTSQMIPRNGWLDDLISALQRSGAAGVGGAIEPGLGLGAVDRAVYLQRYLNYAPPVMLPARPSGENAIYRRSWLDEVQSSWAEGFWETEVQREIEGQGGEWSTAPRATPTASGPAMRSTRC